MRSSVSIVVFDYMMDALASPPVEGQPAQRVVGVAIGRHAVYSLEAEGLRKGSGDVTGILRKCPIRPAKRLFPVILSEMKGLSFFYALAG